MKRTIAVKRADLFKLYLCCRYGNDERMYESSLYIGIPDGSVLDAYVDIALGEYDSEIDDMIDNYNRWISGFERSGFIVNRLSGVIATRRELLEWISNETDIPVPDKIYKVRY